MGRDAAIKLLILKILRSILSVKGVTIIPPNPLQSMRLSKKILSGLLIPSPSMFPAKNLQLTLQFVIVFFDSLDKLYLGLSIPQREIFRKDTMKALTV